MKDAYPELIKRNGFFVSDKLQKKIRQTRLVFVGTGLASSVAVSAARLGFLNFVLVDGDVVEISNLNRQDFTLENVGENKAIATSKRIKSINNKVNIEVIDHYIKKNEVEDLVSKGDIIINCADFNEVTYEIENISSKNNKLSISPLNIGFGSVVLAFNNKSSRLEKITKGIANNDKEYLLNLYNGLSNYRLPDYVKKNLLKIFVFIASKGFFPQNIVAAEVSNALILSTILRHLDKKEIKLAPNTINFDVVNIYE